MTPEATPEQIRTTSGIQRYYRDRAAQGQAASAIAELSTRFEQLKSAFSPPPQLDYLGTTYDVAVTIVVPSNSFAQALLMLSSEEGIDEDTPEAPKSNPGLALTSNNDAVHEYIESLSRLLDKLDMVESRGHASVREQRRRMIRNVEGEAQRIDRWIAAVWNLAQPQAEDPVTTTSVDGRGYAYE